MCLCLTNKDNQYSKNLIVHQRCFIASPIRHKVKRLHEYDKDTEDEDNDDDDGSGDGDEEDREEKNKMMMVMMLIVPNNDDEPDANKDYIDDHMITLV